MKIFVSFSFVLLSLFSFAQEPLKDISKDGLGFNSVFQNLGCGNFKGTISGQLKVKDVNGHENSWSFFNGDAVLDIVNDPDTIYDVSQKCYLLEKDDLKLIYTTYAYANSLFISIKGTPFKITLIDGACLGIINGLDYSYLADNDKEILFIFFSKDVGLWPDRKGKKDRELFILKGSMLCFSINR
jgi:hypothetical protein